MGSWEPRPVNDIIDGNIMCLWVALGNGIESDVFFFSFSNRIECRVAMEIKCNGLSGNGIDGGHFTCEEVFFWGE